MHFLNIHSLKQLKDLHTAMWYYDIQSSTNQKDRERSIRKIRFSIRYHILHIVNKLNLAEMPPSFERQFSLIWMLGLMNDIYYYVLVFSRWGGLLCNFLPCRVFSFFCYFSIFLPLFSSRHIEPCSPSTSLENYLLCILSIKGTNYLKKPLMLNPLMFSNEGWMVSGTPGVWNQLGCY